MPHKCFLIEPTGEATWGLRRYRNGAVNDCPLETKYHNAHTELGRCKVWKQKYEDPIYKHHDWHYEFDAPKLTDLLGDPRWPTHCACGYQFTPEDYFQVWTERLYKGPDGQEYSLHKPPVGALWYAEWLEDLPKWWKGPDGRILMAKTPGGEWCIDSRASNCTMPDDDEHRCWVRHGTPPEIHVDKNGKTCAAGAGSIVSGNYHGFLHNGYFTDG